MMQTMPSPPITIRRKIWIVVRFSVFGVGGLLLMMLFSLDLIEQVIAHNRSITGTIPLVSVVLAIAGAVLMLFAAGEWRRWAYLSVFLSIPMTFGLMTLLPQNITDRLSLPGLGAILAVIAWAAYLSSRHYYRWRASRASEEKL
jgi:hypothetical protein